MRAAAPTRARRSQAERRASTRAALLDATLACLVERGLAGTTTAGIEARAGVSRGARLHHFPTKAGLLAAAVERLYARIGARYAQALQEMGPGAAEFSTGYRLMWAIYADPAHAAVLELFGAARTDPALREALRAVTTRQRREGRSYANSLFPQLATRDAAGLFDTLQALMLGLALSRNVFGETAGQKRALDLMERLVVDEFLGKPEAP